MQFSDFQVEWSNAEMLALQNVHSGHCMINLEARSPSLVRENEWRTESRPLLVYNVWEDYKSRCTCLCGMLDVCRRKVLTLVVSSLSLLQ